MAEKIRSLGGHIYVGSPVAGIAVEDGRCVGIKGPDNKVIPYDRVVSTAPFTDMIKSIEGTAIFMAHQLKAMFQKNLGTKIGYLLCKSGVNDFKKVLDSREVGGSMFLGVQKPVVKAHGSSDDYAMMNAIRQAKICVETGVCDAIAANMDKMTIPKTADEA